MWHSKRNVKVFGTQKYPSQNDLPGPGFKVVERVYCLKR